MTTTKQDHFTLKNIILLSVVFTVGVLFAALKSFPTAAIYSGVVFGWVLGCLNFSLLFTVIRKVIAPDAPAQKGRMAVLLALKLFVFLGIVAAAFWWLHVDVIAFAAGFMTVILAAMIVSFFAKS